MSRKQLFYYSIAAGVVALSVFISFLLSAIRRSQPPWADGTVVFGAVVLILAIVMIIVSRPSKW